MTDTSMPEAPLKRYVSSAVLDQAEKYIFAAVFMFFAYRMINGYLATGSIVSLIYLFDQLVVLAFILLRRSADELSMRVDDWIVGFAGTLFAILIAAPTGAPLVHPYIVTALLIAGFAIHVAAKLALRRSFGVVAANRGIKATGVYRIVRHPMYLGYVTSQLGLILAGPSVYNIVLIGICWLLFIKRIEAEERLLSRDQAYVEFKKSTRFRVIPGVY